MRLFALIYHLSILLYRNRIIFYNVLLSKAIITIMNNQDYVNDINNLSNISYQDKWKNINSSKTIFKER